jgi:MFS family permease
MEYTTQQLKRNISLIGVLSFCRSFMLVMPIITVFFLSNGMNVGDIFILQVIFSVVMVVFEVPSGYLSDVWGRKRTLLAGFAMLFAGYTTYSFAYSYGVIIIAEILLGVGVSFISGTDSALLYDTLLELGNGEQSIHIEGRQLSFGHYSEAVAAVLGGVLAAYDIRYPFYGEAIVMCIGLIATMYLIEPKRKQSADISDTSINSIISQSWKAILATARFALWQHPRLRWLLLFSGITGSATLVMVWFVQPYMLHVRIPLGWFGVIWTVLNLLVGVFAANAHRIESHLGMRGMLIVLCLAMPIEYLVLGTFLSIWVFPALLISFFVRGVNNPIFNSYINREVSSRERATVLSLRQLVTRFVFCIVAPIIGWVNDNQSMRSAFIVCAVLFLALGVVIGWQLVTAEPEPQHS